MRDVVTIGMTVVDQLFMRVTTRTAAARTAFRSRHPTKSAFSPLFIRPSYRMTYVPMYMSIVGTAKATKEDANFLP